MKFKRMVDIELNNKTVLIREDLNVPLKDGKITSDARLRAALPTIELAIQKGAKVIVCSHLGRPTEGSEDKSSSLQPIAAYLTEALKQPVKLVSLENALSEEIQQGQVVLLENVRLNVGEKKNTAELAKKYAALCDVFVMDAFGTAHRAEASTEGVTHYAPLAVAGPLLCAELDALTKALSAPKKPLVAIVAGSKVSTKLDVLTSLAKICDQIIVGGGIANTFLAAAGYNIGNSLYEADLVETARTISQQVSIPLPTDVVVASGAIKTDFNTFLQESSAVTKTVEDVAKDDMILDIGSQTAHKFAEILNNAQTILWNGPVGVFEVEKFAQGTQVVAEAIAKSQAFSIAGGGDTLAAIDQYAVADRISYISTGGGAFLEFVEGKVLPAVAALEQHS